MKTFYGVTFFTLLLGLAILCCYAPWTTTAPGSAGAHDSLGYAGLWSTHFAAVPGARVDPGAFAILAAVIAFFAIVIGGAAYFFRNKRGAEREDV